MGGDDFPARGRHATRRGARGHALSVRALPQGGPSLLREELLVFPAVGPVRARRCCARSGSGAALPRRRRGRGDDLYDLRPYRPGDDPRLIHWRSSAQAQR